MQISILLPYKENYTHNSAGAVSLFVNQTLNESRYKKTTNVFGNTETIDYLDNRYQNIFFKKIFLKSSSKTYVESFLNNKDVLKSNLVEVHNRPNYIKFIKKLFKNKIFLYFHNDPLSMEGSSSTLERYYLLNNVNELIFNSEWSKNRFFTNLKTNRYPINKKIHICYQSSDKIKIDFKKKEKIISFVGKLNSAKGYDIFGSSIIEVLNKHKDWSASVIGHEEREKIIFNHPRFKLLGFKDNKYILNHLKKISISVVCSRWNEPFGRASLESSSRGAAVIISNKGGLIETNKNAIILKKLEKKELVKVITSLIKNKRKLIECQKKNHKGFFLTHKFVSKIIDNIRDNFNLNINLTQNKKILKIMHITNFNNRFDGRLHYNTSKRLNNGFIRLGHNVLSISDRDVISNSRSLRDISGIKALQTTIINNIENFKPDWIVLGHADSINDETLDFIKSQNIKISQWFLDPVGIKTPDFKKNRKRILDNIDLIDNTFLTTDPNSLNIKLNNSFYIPNPCDDSFEILENFNKDCTNDLFFAMSHGVHRGILKKGKFDEREIFINRLIRKNKDLSYDIYGMNQIEPIWGEEFVNAISNSSMGLNLSRGEPTKYYSSDRLAQLMGNGLLTFIDKKTELDDFFTENEVIFYNNIDDLGYKLNKYKKDVKKRKQIAKNGKNKYIKYFNSNNVCQFMINKTFNINQRNKFLWEK